MQSFIFALLLAGVSGVTVVAFKHPNGYAKLFPYMLACTSVIFICFTVWHAAVELTWQRLDEFVTGELLTIAEEQKSGLNFPYGWVLFWYLAVAAFLWANLKLPPFLQITDPAEDDATSDDTN